MSLQLPAASTWLIVLETLSLPCIRLAQELRRNPDLARETGMWRGLSDSDRLNLEFDLMLMFGLGRPIDGGQWGSTSCSYAEIIVSG